MPTPSGDRAPAVAPSGGPPKPSTTTAGPIPRGRPWTPNDDRRIQDFIRRQEAAHPEAKYFEEMHRRIDPLFADAFLSSLDALPATDPLNDRTLVAKVDIVLTVNGELLRVAIAETSGIAAFDAAALDAVQRGAPFGPAPLVLAAADRNVHILWGFHRDTVYACSTMNARLGER